jgi:predicted O-methyltransferase YrrM
MDRDRAEAFISNLYRGVLGRAPQPEEFENWVVSLINGEPLDSALSKFVNSPERLQRDRISPGHTIGSYYSPIVDPTSVTDYLDQVSLCPAAMAANSFPGIEINQEGMIAFWHRNSDWIRKTSFEDFANAKHRYHYQSMYPHGDAVVLRAMIGAHRPQRVIEVGSGYSSACVLDSADEAQLQDFQLTCIEPYPARLQQLLRPSDRDKVQLISSNVQEVPLDRFRELQAGDILLIDSTHVLKTGSDVHYELFHILPVLRPGVLVHFHDIHFPFEYPRDWVITQKYSWNETYAVRAFLMHNHSYEVIFFTHLFGLRNAELIRETCPKMLNNIGGSLWIRKVFSD